MRSEMVNQYDNVAIIKVEIPVEEFEKEVKKVCKDLAYRVNIKGFRKGKVPRKVLEMYIGKKAIYDNAVESMMRRVVPKLIEDYDLKLLKDPEINVSQSEEGKPFIAEITFECVPQTDLPELSDIEVEKFVPEITDELLDEFLDMFREYGMAEFEEKKVEEAAQIGDVVSLSCDLCLKEDENLKVEKENFIDNTYFITEDADAFVKEAVGHKVGDEYFVSLDDTQYADKLPESGKDYVLKCKVKKLFRKVIHDWDEILSKINLESFEELKKIAKNFLVEYAQNYDNSSLPVRAFVRVVESSEVDLPQKMIDEVVESEIKEIKDKLQKQGKDLTDYLLENNLNMEELRNRVAMDVKDKLKQYFVMDALSEEFKIRVENSDINREIYVWSMELGVRYEDLAKEIFKEKREDVINYLVDRVRRRKTLQELINRINIKVKSDVDKAFVDTFLRNAVLGFREIIDRGLLDNYKDTAKRHEGDKGVVEDVSSDSDRADG